MIQESRIEATETAEVRRMPGVAPAPYEMRAGAAPIIRLSWGALIAGSIVAIGVQALLAVLGLAVGLSLAPVTAGEALAVGAGIWWLITALVALFVGGYVAGRFSYIRHPFHSFMHGIMTWCLVTTLSIVFIGWLGGVVAAGPMSAVVDDLVQVQADRQQLRVDVDVPQRVGAGADVPNGQRQIRLDDPATRADAQMGATGAAWWTFIALLLGICAAGFGGYLAAPQNLRETSGGFRGTARGANEPEV